MKFGSKFTNIKAKLMINQVENFTNSELMFNNFDPNFASSTCFTLNVCFHSKNKVKNKTIEDSKIKWENPNHHLKITKEPEFAKVTTRTMTTMA